MAKQGYWRRLWNAIKELARAVADFVEALFDF